MARKPMYHQGMRYFQDRFDTRRLADRLEQVRHYDGFKEEHRNIIEASTFFFLATTDAEGWPDCSYKGGLPGFVRVIDERTLAFPSYDGNGMYRSLGNIRVNPRVGMLFIDFERPRRLRVNGEASVHEEDALMGEFPGAQLMVRVRAERVFPNCPRYIHTMEVVEHSKYAPKNDYVPPVPAWKVAEDIKDALPPGDPAHDVEPE
ncbi:MAG: pyridoxamine 5'-phosphate oxidase family protein [Gammaproteobacteria bacterium]|nr:pyridoxamine 5'-phosphate oxidase family protein [Gammaproteobacteria bacterium]NIM73626.1 pyridoxamine 5'-phosphate oxidase family protein [Gammaproteobacteria bacterium]NIN40280.1 pyridoxamine 5'-phosphate oxidase family protein [Gammaproteobacteria bacterium]NIO25443.1 pyridoxamine 5'-phosphate oxidase family protein [Gammaproteobacteria bacterium]NIO66120.1 pyridoxamine 5'-phosphate oxidase family protein [Gammaproteobacteria bacterium]